MEENYCISCGEILAGEGPFFCINEKCQRHGLLTVVFKKLKPKKTILRSKKKKKVVKSKHKKI